MLDTRSEIQYNVKFPGNCCTAHYSLATETPRYTVFRFIATNYDEKKQWRYIGVWLYL